MRVLFRQPDILNTPWSIRGSTRFAQESSGLLVWTCGKRHMERRGHLGFGQRTPPHRLRIPAQQTGTRCRRFLQNVWRRNHRMRPEWFRTETKVIHSSGHIVGIASNVTCNAYTQFF